MTSPTLVTTTEAAALLGVHPTTIRRKIRSGELEATEVEGDRLVDVSAHLDAEAPPPEGHVRVVGIVRDPERRHLWRPVFVDVPASECTPIKSQPQKLAAAMGYCEDELRQAFLDARRRR